MDLEIRGNTAIVTASTSGLGRAAAAAFVREGANVVINGRDEERLADAVEAIGDEGDGSVVGVQGDITDARTPDRLVRTAIDEFGTVDHLVTSAGGPPSGTVLDLPEEEWHDTFELLVMSVVRLIRVAADPLRSDGGGTVVHITSRAVKEAVTTNPLSSSVRMAVIGLEKTLSRELAPDVRVNAVLPGAHETPRIRELAEQAVERGEYESIEDELAERSESIPVGRLGDPRELGDTVVYLSSPRAGFINGTTVTIDGGQSRSTL